MKIIINKYNIFLYAFTLITLIILFNGCEKTKKIPPAPETGTVTDQQGRVYKTVKIGNQWWMAEDLAVTKYRDGSNIAMIINSDVELWRNDSIGAYCSPEDNSSNLLYNWHAVNNTANIAPLGWHVPSDVEWKELEQHLGMEKTTTDKINWRGTNEGDKLKKKNELGEYYYWNEYGNVWATNESGFSATAPGCRMFQGAYGKPGPKCVGFWWSSTSTINEAWYRHLDYKNSNVFRFYGSKNYGFAVRCVQD